MCFQPKNSRRSEEQVRVVSMQSIIHYHCSV
jgi:hypothetical protein